MNEGLGLTEDLGSTEDLKRVQRIAERNRKKQRNKSIFRIIFFSVLCTLIISLFRNCDEVKSFLDVKMQMSNTTEKSEMKIDSLLHKNDSITKVNVKLFEKISVLDSTLTVKEKELSSIKSKGKISKEKIKKLTHNQSLDSLVKRYGSNGLKSIDSTHISMNDSITKKVITDYTERDQFEAENKNLTEQVEIQKKQNTLKDSVIYNDRMLLDQSEEIYHEQEKVKDKLNKDLSDSVNKNEKLKSTNEKLKTTNKTLKVIVVGVLTALGTVLIVN